MSCALTATVRSATTRGTTCNPGLTLSADHFTGISTMVVHLHLAPTCAQAVMAHLIAPVARVRHACACPQTRPPCSCTVP